MSNLVNVLLNKSELNPVCVGNAYFILNFLPISLEVNKNHVFLAGETKLGKVYLTGSDMGVEGRNIKIEGNNINIYYGLCTVGFG